MAKRGEKRPYRLHFVWENGVRGTETFHSEEARTFFEEQMRRTADQRGMEVTITLSTRTA
jgi:hypothetical protein